MAYLVAAAILFAVRTALGFAAIDPVVAGSPLRLAAWLVVSAVQWTVIGVSAAWVARDAWRHFLSRAWAPAVLLFWILAFPAYISRRFGVLRATLALLGVLAFTAFGVAATIAIVPRQPDPVPFKKVAQRIPKQAAWPMFMQNAQHTGQSPFELGKPTVGGGMFIGDSAASESGSPAVGERGVVYFVNSAGDLIAYAPSSSEDADETWTFSTPREASSSPGVGPDGTIYFSSDKFYAVSEKGKLKWSADIQVAGAAPVVGADSTVYVADSRALYTFRANGDRQWVFRPAYTGQNPPLVCTPTVHRLGGVYFASGRKLHALNPDGSVRWQRRYPAEVSSYPVTDRKGTVYFSTRDRWLHALERDGGARWRLRLRGDKALPALDRSGILYFGDKDSLVAASAGDGSIKWRIETKVDSWIPPVIDVAGIVYFAHEGNELRAVAPSGRLQWSFLSGDLLRPPSRKKPGTSPVALGSAGEIYSNSGDSLNILAPYY